MHLKLHRAQDEAPEGAELAKGEDASRERFRHKAMQQLSKRFERAYDALVDRLFHAILSYVATDVVPGLKLRKSNGFIDETDWPDMVGFASADDGNLARLHAERKLALLTPAQLEHVKNLVRDYHYAFAVGTLGPDAIPPADLKRLRETGITPEDLSAIFTPRPGEDPIPPMRITDLAFQYGRLLGDPHQKRAVERESLDNYVAHLESTRSQLSAVERQAMGYARYNGGQYMRGMGDRLSLELGTLILDADAEQRRKYMGIVASELEDAIDKKQTWRELASDIGHATEDWSRDMQRVGATEMQFAMQEGTARAISKGRDPRDIRVAKLPAPNACADCIRLHLTAGPGSKPRIFKLSELTANGTNVGVKRTAWKATVGPVHPWCGCELVEVPDGWAFDDDGEMVPEMMLRKADRLGYEGELLEKHMTYGGAVPQKGLTIRVADPMQRKIVEDVVKEAPDWLFDKNVGVTLITTDHPRVQNPLEDHDYAYWTANEIRVNSALPIERWPRVIRHELGHSLNVHLMKKLGGAEAVREWHDKLWAISEEEGFVSPYAKKLPIENAAEVTRMYLFEHHRLMLRHPRQFAFVHRAYRDAARGSDA